MSMSQSKKKPLLNRRSLALITFYVAVAGLLVEAATHLCSGYLFNPFLTAGTTAAYAGTAAMLFINEATLRAEVEGAWRETRLCHRLLALVATGAALPVAYGTAVLFAPILPMAIFLMVIGIGFFIFLPFVASVMLTLQAWLLWRDLAAARSPLRYLAVAAFFIVALAIGWGLFDLWGTGVLVPSQKDWD